MVETGRIHRRNVYAKLQISSQQELVAIFLKRITEEHGSLNHPYIIAACSAQPASAVRITTSQGGVFQNTRSVNAAKARPKSVADRIALVQTGS